jgi:hypothetical protein
VRDVERQLESGEARIVFDLSKSANIVRVRLTRIPVDPGAEKSRDEFRPDPRQREPRQLGPHDDPASM